MLSWEYLLLFFCFQFVLIALVLGRNKVNSQNRLKLIFLFTMLLSYNSFFTFLLWINKSSSIFLKLNVLLTFAIFLFIVFFIWTTSYPDSGKKGASRKLNTKNQPSKYGKTGLSKAFSEELKHKLDMLMQTRKPYLSQELRLDDIAELLNISRHHASQVINENYGLNFFDYVNAYRVEEAKRLLQGNQENNVQSISEVAYQSGFNNRVSFYNAFKKVTNTTPTEYLQAKISAINPIFTAKKS